MTVINNFPIPDGKNIDLCIIYSEDSKAHFMDKKNLDSTLMHPVPGTLIDMLTEGPEGPDKPLRYGKGPVYAIILAFDYNGKGSDNWDLYALDESAYDVFKNELQPRIEEAEYGHEIIPLLVDGEVSERVLNDLGLDCDLDPIEFVTHSITIE